MTPQDRHGSSEAPAVASRPNQDISGFLIRSHTADVIVEAWGSTREACVAAAVRGFVATFADVSTAVATHAAAVTVAGDGPDLLVDVLEEIVFRLDVDGAVPVAAEVDAAPHGVELRLGLAPLSSVAIIGAAPKAVTYSELALAQDADGVWRCRATIDV